MTKQQHALIDGLITLLILIVMYLVYSQLAIDSGTSWHIVAAERMLAGGNYLTNLLDDSTPATFAIFIPLIWMHQWLGGSWPPLIYAYVLVIYALPFYPYYKILSKHYSTQYHWRPIYYVTIIFFLLISALCVGQRETFASTFLLPYFFLTASYPTTAVTGKTIQIVAGCLAAIAAAQLPILVPVVLLADIFFNYQRRRYRFISNRTSSLPTAKNIKNSQQQVIIAQLSFYLAFFILMALSYVFYPEYFRTVIPLVLCFESGFDQAQYALIGGGLPIIAILALQSAYLFLQKRKQRAIINLVFINILLLILYFIQGKSWPYHLIILYVLIFSIFGMNFSEKEKNDPSYIEMINFTLLIFMIVIALFTMQAQFSRLIKSYTNWLHKKDPTHQLLQFTRTLPKNKKILTLSVQISPTYPTAHYTKTKIVTPWGNAWIIPDLVNSSDHTKSTCYFNIGKNLFFQIIYETFKKEKPDYLMIDIRKKIPYVNQKNFDYIKYLNQDARIKKILTQYQYQTTVNKFGVFKRKNSMKN